MVSAIGHETDNPILDLVADYRASTPTDAAKRVVPDAVDELARIQQARQRIARSLAGLVHRQQEHLDALRTRPVLADPTASFTLAAGQIEAIGVRARRAITPTWTRESVAVRHHLAHLRAVSPKATLERGYAILIGPDGHSVGSVTEVDPGDDLLAHLSDGQLVVEVRDVQPRGDR